MNPEKLQEANFKLDDQTKKVYDQIQRANSLIGEYAKAYTSFLNICSQEKQKNKLKKNNPNITRAKTSLNAIKNNFENIFMYLAQAGALSFGGLLSNMAANTGAVLIHIKTLADGVLAGIQLSSLKDVGLSESRKTVLPKLLEDVDLSSLQDFDFELKISQNPLTKRISTVVMNNNKKFSLKDAKNAIKTANKIGTLTPQIVNKTELGTSAIGDVDSRKKQLASQRPYYLQQIKGAWGITNSTTRETRKLTDDGVSIVVTYLKDGPDAPDFSADDLLTDVKASITNPFASGKVLNLQKMFDDEKYVELPKKEKAPEGKTADAENNTEKPDQTTEETKTRDVTQDAGEEKKI